MESVQPEMTVANGPEGLMEVLEDFRRRAELDPVFRHEPHYIMYHLNAQQSLIKIDFSADPFQFWYYDLMGRPATNSVKQTVAEFLWEKCGVKQRYEQSAGSK